MAGRRTFLNRQYKLRINIQRPLSQLTAAPSLSSSSASLAYCFEQKGRANESWEFYGQVMLFLCPRKSVCHFSLVLTSLLPFYYISVPFI